MVAHAVYLDDAIVIMRSFKEHLANLHDVFNYISEAGLKVIKACKVHTLL